MDRLLSVWTGIEGGTGISVMHFGNALTSDAPNAVHDFFDAIKGGLPNNITITVASEGDTINPANGQITGGWTSTSPPAPVQGTASEVWSGVSGSRVVWTTNSLVAGRRVRGETVIVPITSNNYDDNGQVAASAIAIFRAAGQALIDTTDGEFGIWSRPFKAPEGSTKPDRVGTFNPVNGCSVPSKATILRSRRD